MSGDADLHLLRVTGLSAGYRRAVVGPVSFELAPGEVLGLWGGNGSGKSTLLDAVAGGARVFGGVIERRAGLRLAYQDQTPVRLPLMPVTGKELLVVAGAALGRAPVAMTPWLDTRLDRLSGGQFQLLSVWAALASPADLVLLDEPTNNLDPHTERLLAEILRAGRGAGGVLLVSHERPFLDAVCTRVIEIGEIGES